MAPSRRNSCCYSIPFRPCYDTRHPHEVEIGPLRTSDRLHMSENGVARSRPPQYQLLGGGGVLLIGLGALWLGCRRWVTPSFSDDDAGVATIWLVCAAILITLGAGVTLQTFVNYVEVGPGFIKKRSFLAGTTRINFGDITAHSYNYSITRRQTRNLVRHSSDRRKIKFSPKDYQGEHVTSVIAFRLRNNRWPSLLDEFDQLAVMEAAAHGSGDSYLRRVHSARLNVT